MKKIMALLFFLICLKSNAQNSEPITNVESIFIEYNGKLVKATKLTISSKMDIDLIASWRNVKTPELLQFVAKGMIRFKSTDSEFPKQWVVGQTYGAKMYIFGFIPFGGTHYLYIEKIDDENHELATIEWDKCTKVWNHNIEIKDIDNGQIYYKDSIVIYGGIMTGFITSFAKRFYKHRQKRWQIVANEDLKFW